MKTKLTIRSAMPEDAEVGAQLICMAMGEVAVFLFGFHNPDRAREVVEKLFANGNNRFSHQFADMAIVDGNAVGLLFSCSGEEVKQLSTPMVWQTMRIYNPLEFLLFLRNTVPLVGGKEAEADEYFISDLAVLPEFQKKGIGTLLLAHAEDKAKAERLKKCSLTVAIDNNNALKLYQRIGYQIVENIKFKQLSRHTNHRGSYRMVKILE
ncbi:MAG: GNAT family N-acetyltransferase [Dehalococcoidia bacterium]|nr:GNAT family N-acetyltransferase [Dehalococcoidia bacterium]